MISNKIKELQTVKLNILGYTDVSLSIVSIIISLSSIYSFLISSFILLSNKGLFI